MSARMFRSIPWKISEQTLNKRKTLILGRLSLKFFTEVSLYLWNLGQTYKGHSGHVPFQNSYQPGYQKKKEKKYMSRREIELRLCGCTIITELLLNLPHRSDAGVIVFVHELITRLWKIYSKHPNIRTLIVGFRLIVFLFIRCLVRNHPESILKLSLIFFQK